MYILGWRLHCLILCIPQRGENSPQEAKRLVHNHISLAQQSKHSDYESSALCFQYMLKKQPEELKNIWGRSAIKTSALHLIHTWTQGRILAPLVFLNRPSHLTDFCCWVNWLSGVGGVLFPLGSRYPVYYPGVLFYCCTVDFYFESTTFTHFPSMGLLTLPRNCLPHSHDLAIFLAIFNISFLTLCD